MDKKYIAFVTPEEFFRNIDLNIEKLEFPLPVGNKVVGEFKGWKVGGRFYPVVKCLCSVSQ